MLAGREIEMAALTSTLERARGGRSSGALFRGDPGSGKTTLADSARHDAGGHGFLVLTAVGRPGGADVAFVGLAGLLRPLESQFAELPRHLQDSIEVALGLAPGVAEAHNVERATFRLLANAADRQPLLLAIDDATWIDDASMRAIAFAVSRFVAEPIAVVMTAERDWLPPAEMAGAVRIVDLGSLSESATRSMLVHEGLADLPDEVLRECMSRTGANPLAMLELVRGLTADERTGGVDLPVIPKPGDAITRGFGRRLAALDPPARRALVVAAADETGERSVVSAALALLGEPVGSLEIAEDAGIIEMERGRLGFTHPLLRAVSYHQVARRSRRAAHRALGASLTSPLHAESRARHLASAAEGPDADVAQALELVARRAARHGASHEAATAFAQSAALTPNPSERRHRFLVAARAWIAGGRPDTALSLVESDAAAVPADGAAMTLEVIATSLVDGSLRAATVALACADRLDEAPSRRRPAPPEVGRRIEVRRIALALAADEFRRAGLLERSRDTLSRLDAGDDWAAAMARAISGDPGLDVGGAVAAPPSVAPAMDLLERRLAVVRCDAFVRLGRFEQALAEISDVRFATDPVDGYVLEIAGLRARAALGLDPKVGPAARAEFAALIDSARRAPGPARAAAEAVLGQLDTLMAEQTNTPTAIDPLTSLTTAERRVADAVGGGRTNREAAETLFLSVKTIDFHLQQIYRKLQLRSRAELAILVTRSTGSPA